MARMIRPKAVVLDNDAMIPDRNIVKPAPNQFTHVVTQTKPYYYNGRENAKAPDGEFKQQTRVVLIRHDGGNDCWVASEEGLYAETDYRNLKKL